MKEGVGLGFELCSAMTGVSLEMCTFSVILDNCCKLKSRVLVKPCKELAEIDTGIDWGREGGGIILELIAGGTTNDMSLSNDVCIEVGREIGELVLIELEQPTDWFTCSGEKWANLLVLFSEDFTFTGSLTTFPNTSYN